jgi:hypothetical protein
MVQGQDAALVNIVALHIHVVLLLQGWHAEADDCEVQGPVLQQSIVSLSDPSQAAA